MKISNYNLTFICLSINKILFPRIRCCCTKTEHNVIDSKPTSGSVYVVANNVKTSINSLRSELADLKVELTNVMQLIIQEIEFAVTHAYENMQFVIANNNEEIIKEMHGMNLELKKRGETISELKQSFEYSEKENNEISAELKSSAIEIKSLVSQINFCEHKLEENNLLIQKLKTINAELEGKTACMESLYSELERLNSQIKLKDDVIVSLKCELNKPRDLTDGDLSSVGTISRADEVSRLKDVEDSFEDKYTKMRLIAIKMKKKIDELEKQLKFEQTENNANHAKIATFTHNVKNTRLLQDECDKLSDELEFKMNEIKELKKIISETDKSNDDFKLRVNQLNDKIAHMEENLSLVKNERTEFESKFKSMITQLENMKKEKSASEIVLNEREREITKLKKSLQEHQTDLEEAKYELKKNEMVSAELKDHEKTILSLSSEINEKNKQINKLNFQLVNDSDTRNELTTRLKQLEEQVTSYVDNDKSIEDQIVTLNKTISECEHSLAEKECLLMQTVQCLEMEKTINESNVRQLDNITAELKASKSLNDEVKNLKENINGVKDMLRKKENEYEQLKSDYENYKIRAHAVLQKLKSENSNKDNEEKLKNEVSSLEKTIKDLKQQLDLHINAADNSKIQYSIVESAKEKLQQRVKELSDIVKTKTIELDIIKTELKTQKMNTDTLINCHKVENEKLKNQIENLKILEVKPSITENDNSCFVGNDAIEEKINIIDYADHVCNMSNGSHYSELENIDEANTIDRKRKHSLVPLDKLLESNHVDEYWKSDSEKQEHVKSLEHQISHLNSILNESENNAARNEQQVCLLKEEIRRLQRMFEREPHVQNTEYLKNVMLKFISLPLGDEKCRLVSVLETILKLTPEEKITLSSIAKGYRPDQKTNGWTSYLGWS